MKLLYLLILAILTGCTGGDLDIQRVTEFLPITFESQKQKTVEIASLSPFDVPAECDPTTTGVLFREKGGEWQEFLTASNSNSYIGGCASRTGFNFNVNSSFLSSFTKGVSGEKVFEFRAQSGKMESEISELKVKYSPSGEIFSPTGMEILPASVKRTGANHKMQVKFGRVYTAPAAGTNHKIKTH